MELKGEQMKNIILGVAFSAFAFVALANSGSPYIGQEQREIKALSQQQVADYLAGKGLGFAKAAELNHFPGPRHVLDVAMELDLTEEQTKQTQAIFDVMKEQASSLGEQYVEKEQELDRAFNSGNIAPESLKTLLSEIGALKANIRYVHLNAHLEQKILLTQHQIYLYDQLRGYGASPQSGGHHHSH